MESLIGVIISFAMDYEGLQEKSGNMGFKKPWFERLMRSIGFKDTHAWCAYFCELVWTQAYTDWDKSKLADLARLFSGGAVRTYRNFKRDPNWEVSAIPTVGAVAIWRKYKAGVGTGFGHAGIVIDFNDTYITTMDGNTNDKGGREGYIVAPKQRRINFKDTKGLVLMGFITEK